MGAHATERFLTHILPPVGVYILFLIGPDGKPRQFTYESIKEMAEAALSFDLKGFDVYHACASFNNPKRPRVRAQDNVLAIKSIWADLDCGPGKEYTTAKEAGTHLLSLCKKHGLPIPTIVSSGRGLHCYWVFDTPLVNTARAKEVAVKAKAALQAIGLKIDPTRTGDIASVLRPAGTHWRKDGEREVVVKHWAPAVDRKAFLDTLLALAPEETVVHGMPDKTDKNDEFAIPQDYPPSDAREVIKHCAAIRHVAAKKGDVPEPLWYAAVGTLSYTTQGFKAGHAVSKGYAGYSYTETQERMERWQATCSGPATCDKFKSIDSSLCAGCPHKVSSPIQLGYTAEEVEEAPAYTPVEVPVEVVHAAELPNDPVERQIELDEMLKKKLPDDIAYWSKQLKLRYRLSGNELQFKTEAENEDGDPVEAWVTMLDVWIYPYRTRKNSEGERTVEFYVRRLVGRGEAKRAKWEVISIPGSHLADINSLIKTLGSYGIYEASALNRKVRPMVKQYLRDTLRAMEELRGEVDEFDRMGWTPGEESFVIGDQIVSDGVVFPAVVAPEAVPGDMIRGLRPSGSMDDWVSTIDKVYNRPGAEAYQFTIAAAFAAPLVRLANIPDFHGIPVAITGEGANGKTTVTQVACSVYGDPLTLYAGGGESQATTNALLAMVSKVSHLPFLFDEITNRKSEDMQTILYAISNGRPKLRMRRDGKSFQDSSKMTWDTITFVTSNDKITEVLQRQGDTRVVDATQVRVFEVHIDDHIAARLFPDVDPMQLQKVIAQDYGHVGLEYLKFISRNQHNVRRVIEQMRKKVMPTNMEAADMKERFYRELIALTLAGAHIAGKLGLIKFDIKRLKDWAEDHVKRLRQERVTSAKSAQDVLAQFLSENMHGIVLTERWPSKKASNDTLAVVADRVRNPVGRIAKDPGKVYIDKNALDRWLDKSGVSKTWFLKNAEMSGLLLPFKNRVAERVVIYKGTDLPNAGMRIYAYEFNPAMVVGDIKPDLQVVSDEALGS